MEVSPGYKNTEVGILPEDWRVRFLPDVCKFQGGKAHEQHISELGRYVCVNSKFISSDGAVRKYATANLCPAKKGDILMVMSDLPNGRALAKAYLVEADSTYAVNQRVCALTAYIDAPEYLFYVLNRNPYFLKFDDGVNQTHLLNPVFQKCPLALPPTVEEQRAIAAALSDVDALLGGLDRLIAKKRDLKQAAMQQLLTGQTRLAGFHGKWETKQLGDICEISMGRTPPRRNQSFWGRGYTWMSIADLQSKVVSESKEEITSNAASMMSIIPKGTLLMSFKLTIGRLCFAGRDLFTNEAICAFNKLQVHPEFLYYALGRTNFSLYGKQAVKGYTLNKESLKSVEVRVPSGAEQVAIATVLSDMDSELSGLEARRDKTSDLKLAMMRELLTGKTRLLTPEAANG